MTFTVAPDRSSITLNCNRGECSRHVTVTPQEPDNRAFVAAVAGWAVYKIGAQTLTFCPGCVLQLPPEMRVLGIASLFPEWLQIGNDDHDIHGGYDDDLGGPPGACRLCGQLIDAEDIWLAHSPNYPHVPRPYARFPAHRECWRRITTRFIPGSIPYRETYRRGW